MRFERLGLDAVNRTSQVREFASGKSTNVARVLHTLGEEAIALTFIGGMRGKAFREDLESAGITHDLIEVQPQIRMAITVVDQATGTATELVEEPQPLRESDYEAMLARLSDHLQKARMLVLSGTLPPQAKPDFYARCVQYAVGVPVIVDAVGPPLLQTLVYHPFIIKPNRFELSRTLQVPLDSDDTLRSTMRELVNRGAQWVITTNGAKETLITNGQSFWRIANPAVETVSTIGSGDAFAAGLARAIVRGEDVPHACLLAAACGAANALTADAGRLRPADVERLVQSVRLTVD